MRLLPTSALLATAALLAGCSAPADAPADAAGSGEPSAASTADASDGTDAAEGDRSRAVAATVDGVAVPAHVAAAGATRALADSLASTCADGSDESAAADAWYGALAARGRQRVALAGPGMRSTSIGRVDWVVDAPGVRERLAGGAGVDVAAVASAPAGQRGLGVVGLLLAEHDLAAGGRPCTLAASAATLAADEQDAVVAAWRDGTDGDPPFRDVLTGDAATARTTQGALDELVRVQVFELDDLVDGLVSGALVDPDGSGATADGEEGMGEGPGGGGAAQVRGTLDGLTQLYADEHLGGQLSAPQRAALREHLAAVDLALEPLGPDLAGADSATLQQLHDALDAVRVDVRTTVVSALDVLVGFSSNDGDAG